MSRNLLRRAFLVIPLGLATLAGCKDTETTAPKFRPSSPFAQGAGGVWTVNKLLDPGDGTCDDTDCTLREAIAAAAPGDQIVFAGGLQGTINLAASPLVIDKNLSIDGGGRITLEAAIGQRVMETLAPTAVGTTIALTGLTFTKGASSLGAGIFIRDLTAVTIRNSAITGSSATGSGGGVMVALDASLSLENSTVDGNTVTGAGGLGGGLINFGTLVVRNSTISNNLAPNGGGIYNAAAGSVSIALSTVSGNTATSTAPASQGSGIATFGTLNLTSTTIAKNAGTGLGLVVYGGTTSVANSIIAGQCVRVGGALTSLGYNLTDAPCLVLSPGPGDATVFSAVVFSQVLDQNLANNGGPTKTHALIARGLAVDAGRCPAETTDQRGFARPVDDPTVPNASDTCDMGAYEAQGPSVAVADLMVSQTVDKNSVKQGELLTYSIRVQNLGPQTAPNVVLNNVLSSGVTFVAARQNKGTITAPPRGETGTVTWNLGDMADQANEVAEIQVTVLVRGKTTITNTATVSGNVTDPNAANNTAAITVTVAPGSSGKKG